MTIVEIWPCGALITALALTSIDVVQGNNFDLGGFSVLVMLSTIWPLSAPLVIGIYAHDVYTRRR